VYHAEHWQHHEYFHRDGADAGTAARAVRAFVGLILGVGAGGGALVVCDIFGLDCFDQAIISLCTSSDSNIGQIMLASMNNPLSLQSIGVTMSLSIQ
jgi:hypothetical protein